MQHPVDLHERVSRIEEWMATRDEATELRARRVRATVSGAAMTADSWCSG